jgi:DNA repair protein RecN (Recombination protein N)
MITDLTIQNLVLIDKAQISFARGFNVITGDTGAGKSLLVKALKLVMGARTLPKR